MTTDKPRRPTALLMARIPYWLFDRLLAESNRRGVGYWRLVAAGIERELFHRDGTGEGASAANDGERGASDE